MVRAVYGTCNGSDIILKRTGADTWSVPVPADESKYIIEIFAEDEAGNISYIAKYIYYWDGSSFQAIFRVYEWQSEVLADSYIASLVSAEKEVGTMYRNICMDLGKTRHVQLLVKNIKETDFTIRSAEWSLQDKYVAQVESEGECTIKGHTLDALITPQHAGIYHLKMTYKISDETLIDIIEIRVN